MKFGDPVIYKCPSCKKPMKMPVYMSYTVHGSSLYSDGYNTGKPGFTPDFAKCPNCGFLFFRHKIKKKKKVKLRSAGGIERIKKPERGDFIKALGEIASESNIQTEKTETLWSRLFNKTYGTIKTLQDEKQVREDLWRELNHDIRHGKNNLSDEDFKIWKENCFALLPLMEKSLEETGIQIKKGSRNFDESGRNTLLTAIAELYRNLENYNKCMEIINTIDAQWDWLKIQFIRECEKRNFLTFELLSKKDMNPQPPAGKSENGE